ncbi:MAG: hypothetical protein ACR2KV_00100 [Solirubrobacteraceae bacterium]
MAGVGGVLLLVSLFLDWYTMATFTVTAWTAFEVWDIVLAALALAMIVTAATEMGWWRGPVHSLALSALGVAALVIVVSQLIDRPPSVLHSGIGSGGWLALVGAILMAAGALMAESRVTLSFNPGGPRGGGPGGSGWRRPARGPADVPLAGPPPRRPGPLRPDGRPVDPVVRPPDRSLYEEEPGFDPPPPRV